MSKYAIITHKKCNDGTAAAYVFKEFHHFEIPDEDFFFLAHTGEQEEDLEKLGFFEALKHKDELFVVDFSLELDLIESLLIDYPDLKITEVDHHKTFMTREGFEDLTKSRLDFLQSIYKSKDDGEARYRYCYDKTVSGAVLLYLYLHGLYDEYAALDKEDDYYNKYLQNHVPLWLLYIQDRDIWKWHYGESKAYCEAFFDYASNPYDILANDGIADLTEEFVTEGRALLRRKDNQVSNLTDNAFAVSFQHQGETYKGIAVNANQFFTSDVCNALLKQHLDLDFALGFEYNGQYWKCGVRSLGTFDTCIISTCFGGGGHQAASGFRVDAFEDLKEHFNF